MPERASVTQSVQIGVEATPGTAVAANKLLSSIGFEPGVAVDFNRFRPQGQKYASQIVPGREWVTGRIAGVGSYSELVYPLSSILVSVSPTTVDTSAKKWTFAPAARTEDTVKTFTLEQGGAVRAHKFAYLLVAELSLEFTRAGVNVGGSFIGQKLSDNIAMTGSPSAIEEKPILPANVDVWIDSTFGALGTTKMTRDFVARWSLGDRFNPVWPLNSANPSFASHVEAEPNARLGLVMAADAQGMGLLTDMRAGATKFVRIKATSAELAGAATEPYSLTIDAACKVNENPPFEDQEGVYAVSWTFEPVYDAGWGKTMEVVAVNKVSAL